VSTLFYFFQAEDGIRDRNVTGVQTCALPILPEESQKQCSGSCRSRANATIARLICAQILRRMTGAKSKTQCSPIKCSRASHPYRSEERRVGKECRIRPSRSSDYQ